jgi:hypothetical protein
VRKLALLLATGLALVPAALAVRAATPQTLSTAVSSHRVLYGHHLSISGRLRGGLVAGRTVTIDAWPYGSSAPHRLAAVSTNVSGAFAYRVAPTVQTTYQAHAGPAVGPKITIGVVPRVSVAVLANGRVRAHVGAGRTFASKTIELQRRNTDGTWTTVARKKLSGASIAVISPGLPVSTIRIAMSVNQAGAGYLGAASHPLMYRPLVLTLMPSSVRVGFGHAISLDGRLVNGKAGEHIAIIARPYGHSSGVRIATVVTGPHGRFSLRVRPTIQTTYQARLGTAQSSTMATVGVAPAITVHELANGVLKAHVAATPKLLGRMVELQRLTAPNTWQTVAKRPLSASSTATFTLALPHSTIRFAMSVNQAGAGYLGAATHPFLYRAL